jgi:nucleotide-binding universal stress UspA family protein
MPEVDMYQTILVPLDGSKRAEAILPHVENLVHCYQAKMILLRVVEPHIRVSRYESSYEMLTHEQLEHWIHEAETYLATLQKAFEQKGLEVEVRVSHGHVVEAIIAEAEREHADLIAMASHGRTGLARVFYGSIAAGVLHRIDRPLLLIRSLEHESD